MASCEIKPKQSIYAISDNPELFISEINGEITIVQINPDFQHEDDDMNEEGEIISNEQYIPVPETQETQKIIENFLLSRSSSRGSSRGSSHGGSIRKTRRKLYRGGGRKKSEPVPKPTPKKKSKVPAKKASETTEETVYVKRKNTVTPATELIVCIVLSNNEDFEEIENEIEKIYQMDITGTIPPMFGANSDKTRDYIIDIKARPRANMLKYAKHFFDNLKNLDISSITGVRLLGIGGDIENKSDVTCNGIIGGVSTEIGFSVKMGKPTKINAALSNVQEKIPVRRERLDITGLKSAAVDDFFKKNQQIQKTGKTDGKTNRAALNKFFVNMNLPMWRTYNEWILNHSDSIANYLASCLYSQSSAFPVYECSDTTLVHLNKYQVVSSRLVSSASLVSSARWNTGKVAKLFYVLKIRLRENETGKQSDIILKIELRFKSGNYCDGSSPQFFAFELPANFV